MVTRGEGRGVFLRGQPRLHPKEAWSQCPQIFGTYMRARTTRNSSEILHDDQTRCVKTFTRSTTPSALTIFFVTRMVTRDLFAAANFVVMFVFVLSVYTCLRALLVTRFINGVI